MKTLEQVLHAIKTLDFNALVLLLDHNKSYMDVPKSLFLERLEESIMEQLGKDFKGFDRVIKGICSSCNKGCDAYSFQSKGYPSLNLFFEMQKDEINDIYLCCHLIHDDATEEFIDFFFYKEETERFIPTERYLFDKQRADQAVEEFNKMTKDKYVAIENLFYWNEKFKDLTDAFGWHHGYHPYKYLVEFDSICRDICDFVELYETVNTAKKAMREYKKIANEKDLVVWLFKYQRSLVYDKFEGIGDWMKTGFLKFKLIPDLIVDCTECMDAFEFSLVFTKERYRLKVKYQREGEDYDGIMYDLKTYLRFRNKYLDILPSD